VFLGFGFNPIAPLVGPMSDVLTAIHHFIPNYGWAMIVLALVVRVVLWPLTAMQFRSMAEMQKVAPLIKQIQAQYKGDPQGLQQAQMALYKEHKINPLAGCVPLLIQFPILIALFWAINDRIGDFKEEHWLWIGSSISHAFPQVFAQSLAGTDLFLLAVYVASMYFTVRYGSPPSQDPQQAQTQKIMAFMSPAMIAYFGFQYKWASALYIYWLATNIFTLAQQYFMFRRYGLIGAKPAATATVDATPSNGARKQLTADGETATRTGGNGKSNRAKKRAGRQ